MILVGLTGGQGWLNASTIVVIKLGGLLVI